MDDVTPGVSSGALDGVLVLDVTQMLAGPIAGMRLGDLGADVLKIEPPDGGEFCRSFGFQDVKVEGEMTTFLALNRNKRSVPIDLKHPKGLETMLALVERADVLIQNFRQGTAERLGLGYPALREVNPRLIYCSISGYGPTGPYRNRPGQDLVIQGFSGSMYSVGRDGDPPTPSALWGPDVMSGYQAVIGILAALHARHSTARGQHVEVDMLSVVLDSQIQELVTFLNSGVKPERSQERTAHASIAAPYGVYQTSDGWITLAMCYLPNLGEALDDDWLRTLDGSNDGNTHRDDIYRRIRSQFVERTTADWVENLNECGVWSGPVYDYVQLEKDIHVVETGMLVEQPQLHGPIRTVRPPLHLSETPPKIRAGAPILGEHTAEVLHNLLGYSNVKISELLKSGAIAVAESSSISLGDI